MFKQLHKRGVENLLFCIHSLGDDQCVDVMNKKTHY